MKSSSSPLIWALSLAILLSGCYFKRLTNVYDDTMDGQNAESNDAIIAETGNDAESKKARQELLERLASEEGMAYRINAGDKISVQVYGHEDLNITTKVSPDGSIGMIFVGQLFVSGRTISEARDAIEKGLLPYLKHPVVGVTVLEVSSETVTISGATSKPGLYNISDSSRLADAYAQAGGSATRLLNGYVLDVADLENSILVREGQILPVDFRAAIEHGDKLNNVRLRKGDYIFIAQRSESSVTICGEVRNPQRRIFEKGMGLIEALTTAGWMTESHWSHVIIIRNGLANPTMYKVDVDGILAGRCKNVPLKPNDIVYVPKDNLAEYNVFVRKLMPTATLLNLMTSTKVSTISL